MSKEDVFYKIKEGLLACDEEAVGKAVKEVIDEGLDVLEAMDILTATLREVGGKYEAGEAFLPEMMMAADTVKASTAPWKQYS